jgi:hypothetical protein
MIPVSFECASGLRPRGSDKRETRLDGIIRTELYGSGEQSRCFGQSRSGRIQIDPAFARGRANVAHTLDCTRNFVNYEALY